MRVPRGFALLAGFVLAIGLTVPAFAAGPSATGNSGAPAAPSSSQNYPGQQYLNHFENSLTKTPAAGHLPAGFTSGPTTHDLTYLMLRRLLGQPVVTVLDTAFHRHGQDVGGITALTLTLGLFPYIAMFVSSILILYWITVGMFATTATGELLGKKWDTWAMPTRSTLAYLLLMPFPPFAPLCGIQAAVLALSLLGIGAGSAFFDEVVNYLVSTPVVVPVDNDTGRFINQVAHSELCLALGAQNGLFKPTQATYTRTVGMQGLGLSSENTKVTRWNFGPNGGVCGSFVIYGVSPPPEKGSLADLADYQIAATLRRQQPQILKTIIAHVKQRLVAPLVSGTVHMTTEQYAERYHLLAEELQGQINQAVGTLRHQKPNSHISQLAQAISSSGFVTAGTVYWTLERRQDAFVHALNHYLPQVSSPVSGEVGNSWLPLRWFGSDSAPLKRQYAADSGVLDAANQRYHTQYTPQGALDSFYTRTSSEGTLGKSLSVASTWIAEKLVQIPRLGSSASASNPNPLLEIKMLGQQLEDAIVLFEVAKGLGGVVEDVLHPVSTLAHGIFGGGSSGGSGGIGTLLNVVLLVAFALGFVYANIIPMMPYVLWTVAVIGYLIYLLGMLIGSPFWWSMKAHPDGEGLVGRARAGYPMVLTLILYPILMVAGLVVGMAVIRVGGWLINETLWTAFSDMSIDGFNILSLVGKLAIFAILYMTLTWKAFAQTWELPQMVLRMMGVGAAFSDMGENEAKQHSTQIAQRVTAGIGSALNRA